MGGVNWLVVTTVELTCIGLSYAGFHAYGGLVAHWVDAAGWLRRGLSVGLPVVATATAVLLDVAGLRQAIRTALPSATGTAVGTTALTVGAYLAVLAGYRATVPVDAAIRETTVDPNAATRQFAWFAATVMGGIDAVAVSLMVGSWWTPAVVIAVAAVGFFVVAPGLVSRLNPTRPLSTDERRRVRDVLDCYAAATGCSVSTLQIVVLDTDDSRWAGAFVRGPPWRQLLFVASHLLEAHPTSGIRMVLAVAVGRAKRGYFAWKVVTTAILGIGVVSAITTRRTPVWSLLVALVAVGVYLTGCWWARRCLFGADADAFAVTDSRTVVETHQRIAADADTTLDTGTGVRNFLRGRASRARRLRTAVESRRIDF